MDRRQRESLLWGAVGGLSFLVLLQGYELVTGQRVDLGVKFGVAVLVFAGAAAVSFAWTQRLEKERS